MSGLNKKELLAEIERDRRRKLKVRLAELHALIGAARAHRREAVAVVRVQCREARVRLRAGCVRRVEVLKAEGARTLGDRMRAMAEEQETDRLLRNADRAYRGVTKARSSSSERRAESDDEVKANLPPELAAVFDLVRSHVKRHPRRTRTESFLEWAEANPDEIYAMQSAEAERSLARLIAEHERAERLSRRRGRLAAGDVPF